MSLVPRPFRRAASDPARADLVPPGATTTRDRSATTASFTLGSTPLPAKATPCPGEPGRAQVVVLDGAAVPGVAHYRAWAVELADRGFTSIRTGALAPRHATQAEMAGLHCAQELVLLRLDAPLPSLDRRNAPGTRLHRLADDGYRHAAAIDEQGFGERWHLDAQMLADIRSATPRARTRLATTGGAVSGFLISGRSGRIGYLQRLAVDPTVRRRGVATALIGDAFGWMRRIGVRQVYVNTHTDNDGALALYRHLGFRDVPERLRVYEGDISR